MQSLITLDNDENFGYMPDFLLLERNIEAPSQFRFSRKPFTEFTTLSKHINDKTLEHLVIDDEIAEIENYAFCGCSNLQAVTGGLGLKTIGGGAFYNCSSLHTVVLQDGTKEIGSGAFFGCCNLKEIYIPSSVYQIGSSTENDRVFDGNPIILCEHESFAEQYARSHNIKYRIV